MAVVLTSPEDLPSQASEALSCVIGSGSAGPMDVIELNRERAAVNRGGLTLWATGGS